MWGAEAIQKRSNHSHCPSPTVNTAPGAHRSSAATSGQLPASNAQGPPGTAKAVLGRGGLQLSPLCASATEVLRSKLFERISLPASLTAPEAGRSREISQLQPTWHTRSFACFPLPARCSDFIPPFEVAGAVTGCCCLSRLRELQHHLPTAVGPPRLSAALARGNQPPPTPPRI